MKKRQPNVLLLFVDQMRADAIGAAGNPVIRTPSLDRLCHDGVRFTNAFSASPVCISARCSMITASIRSTPGATRTAPCRPTIASRSWAR